MKKSEMVEIMARKLERCHDRYGNLFKFELVANELLEGIEEVLTLIWEPETEDKNG